MQKQSMKQQYKRDIDLTEKENELLQRLHNKDETLKEIDIRDFERSLGRFDSYFKFKGKLFEALEKNTTVKSLILSNQSHNTIKLAKVLLCFLCIGFCFGLFL